MNYKIIIKTVICTLIFLVKNNINAQNVPSKLDNTKLNFSFPTNPSVYEFSKYGNIPVNEYRGLANISIPIYDLNLDGVNIPIGINYHSGGIKVSEEAGLVGLGWNMSFPTIVQNIKDEDDLNSFTKFQTLPGFTGNPIFPTIGGLNPNSFNVSFFGSMAIIASNCTNATNVGYSNTPGYFVSSGDFLPDKNGDYPCSSSYYEMTYNYVDSEPDIFSVSINGDNLILVRDDIGLNTPVAINNVTLPLKIINGHTEYKVELTNGIIKIIDYNGNQYFFGDVEKINYQTYNNGFLYSSVYPNTGGPSTGVTSKLHRLTKIITNKNQEINFSYSKNLVKELTKDSFVYYKNLGTTINYTYSQSGYQQIQQIEGVNQVTFQTNESNMFSQSSTSQNQNYSFINAISTPNEIITFNYSSRTDYEGMKKLDNIVIKNNKNTTIKNIAFSYDYLGSSSGYLNSRLSLNAIQINSENPYLFSYNQTELPSKKAYSIDYWGYYNGKPNTSFLPNLSDLGYTQYNDNSQNNFKSSLSFCKAGVLEKIVYPTGGYSEFDYELNTFDDLILHPNMSNYTPLITSGGGLRIKAIKNYTSDAILSKHTTYNYFNGKVIFKKRLARQITGVKSIVTVNFDDNFSYNVFNSDLIEANISNGNLGNVFVDDMDDYIGYDKVIIEEIGATNHGKIEKEFINNSYNLIFPLQKLNFRPSFYRDRNYIPNGTLKSERIFDASSQLKFVTENTYSILTSNINRYGVGFSHYDTSYFFQNSSSNSNPFEISVPRFLLTFYPIFSNSVRLSSQKTTEYFPSGNKWTSTEHYYNSNNIPTGRKMKDQYGNYFYEESSIMTSSTDLINRNILNLPSSTAIKENGVIKKYYQFLFSTVNNVILPQKVEELPEGNPNPANKINVFYDLYDDKSNLIQYHKENDIYTSIIWGYDKTLPVAKIENVQYSTIQSSLITAVQNASDTGTETQLLDALNNLRTALPNAMITSYTHKPLVGVSSITDMKGDKVTYYYDANNRLQFVKDKDGNILNENEYHFRPQN